MIVESVVKSMEERRRLALRISKDNENRKGIQDIAYQKQREKEERLNELIPEHEQKYMEDIRKEKIKKLIDELADYLSKHYSNELRGSMFNKSVREYLGQIIERYIKENKIVISGYQDEKELAKEMLNEIAGLGPIDAIIEKGKGKISEIWVNGENPITNEVDVYYEMGGVKYKETEIKFRSKEHAFEVAKKIARNGQQAIGDTQPIANVRYPDGRVNIVISPIATGGGGPYISFRLFPEDSLLPEDFVKKGVMSEELRQFLAIAIKYGANGLFVGATGSGKTTTLAGMIHEIPDDERILLMEDTEEMRLRHKYPNKHIITEEVSLNRTNEEMNFDLSKLTINALRQKPDYMIYGEVRDKAAYHMLNGANTGHKVWSTIHARSATNAIQRLKNMILEHGSKMDPDSIGAWIVESIDIIVFQQLYPDKVRRVKEVVQLIDYKDGKPIINKLFEFVIEDMDENGNYIGKHYRTGRINRELAEFLLHEGATIEELEPFMKAPESVPKNTITSKLDEYYQSGEETNLKQLEEERNDL